MLLSTPLHCTSERRAASLELRSPWLFFSEVSVPPVSAMRGTWLVVRGKELMRRSYGELTRENESSRVVRFGEAGFSRASASGFFSARPVVKAHLPSNDPPAESEIRTTYAGIGDAPHAHDGIEHEDEQDDAGLHEGADALVAGRVLHVRQAEAHARRHQQDLRGTERDKPPSWRMSEDGSFCCWQGDAVASDASLHDGRMLSCIISCMMHDRDRSRQGQPPPWRMSEDGSFCCWQGDAVAVAPDGCLHDGRMRMDGAVVRWSSGGEPPR